jgi:hypothetical protein
MRYEIDQEAGLVRIAGSGAVTDQEMVDCVSALRRDPDLQPSMCTLSDMRGIEVAFTADGVARMIQVMEETRDRRDAARAAIVADSNAAFGMGRMFEMRAEDRAQPRFGIFRDMESAMAWLEAEKG